MKKFFKFAAVAAIAAMFVCCTEKPGPDPEKPNNQEQKFQFIELFQIIVCTPLYLPPGGRCQRS